MSPNNDGDLIRLNIPALTEERRIELVKVVHKSIEEGRVAIRNLRRDCRDLQDNTELRIKYLMNEIDEFSFKEKVQKKEKQRNKKMAILHIY